MPMRRPSKIFKRSISDGHRFVAVAAARVTCGGSSDAQLPRRSHRRSALRVQLAKQLRNESNQNHIKSSTERGRPARRARFRRRGRADRSHVVASRAGG